MSSSEMPDVVATFPTLVEAQVACGALRAAGFDAEVLDQNMGQLLPPNLIGGFRLVVGDDEAAQARSALAAIRAQTT